MSGAFTGRRSAPLRIANCSGFYGDRLSAAREMVEGGPIDVLTGDWLAELTMYVLHKTRQRGGGIARTFLRQMDEVLPSVIERGITVVANAGGLDPPGAAAAVRELARRHGLEVTVASVCGDDVTAAFGARTPGQAFKNLDTGEAFPEGAQVVTANAYLGGAPIAAALAAGAQIVVTGRVSDASLVVGPGIAAFGWGPEDLDALAGAVVAGHVIECGAQCCGGNYSFFDEVPDMERCGFPLVELAHDGSSVVTKHPGTSGLVSVGTVTAQLLYEIASPRYLSPDAVARFDTVALRAEGPDRVAITGTRGEPPPPTLKVAANLAGGWRNAMTLVLTGGQIKEKAAVAEAAIWAAVPGGRQAFDDTCVELTGDLLGHGEAYLRVAVRGGDEAMVGRGFSSAVVETTLASYPGTYFTSAPGGASEVARYWPTLIDSTDVEAVVDNEGATVSVLERWATRVTQVPTALPSTDAKAAGAGAAGGVEVPVGVLVGARSGDKGGNANIGLWADDDEVFTWLREDFGVRTLASLLPETAGLSVERFELVNLRAINFVVHGILGWGVASNLRADSQAKGLGERLRSQSVTVPARLVEVGSVKARHGAW